jgi:hypothetical protein
MEGLGEGGHYAQARRFPGKRRQVKNKIAKAGRDGCRQKT